MSLIWPTEAFLVRALARYARLLFQAIETRDLASRSCAIYPGVRFFGRPFLLKITWLAFGLGRLDCDENRGISRMKVMRLTQNEHHWKLRVPIRDISD
jgi:hypothetical protein